VCSSDLDQSGEPLMARAKTRLRAGTGFADSA